MTEKSLPDALTEKNARDFDAMTRAIEDALKKIERDHRLKPTQATLSRLANCTRGTLNNRGWPLTRLSEIKLARGEKQKPQKSSELQAVSAKAISEIDTLKERLQLSRTENARLHAENSLLRKDLQQAKNLLEEVGRLTKNTRQDVTPSRFKPSPSKVVALREGAVAKSDGRPSEQ